MSAMCQKQTLQRLIQTTDGKIKPNPPINNSAKMTLRNAASSSFPYSLNPTHRPATIAGKPIKYSRRVSTVIARAAANDMTFATMAASNTGWKTAR